MYIVKKELMGFVKPRGGELIFKTFY